jgi:hypothetical protein
LAPEIVPRKVNCPTPSFYLLKNALLLFGKFEKVSQNDVGKNIQPQDPSQVYNEH